MTTSDENPSSERIECHRIARREERVKRKYSKRQRPSEKRRLGDRHVAEDAFDCNVSTVVRLQQGYLTAIRLHAGNREKIYYAMEEIEALAKSGVR